MLALMLQDYDDFRKNAAHTFAAGLAGTDSRSMKDVVATVRRPAAASVRERRAAPGQPIPGGPCIGRDDMNLVTALAIVIGVMGGIATWLVLGPLALLGLQIWIIFIAWASYFHCGGGETGLKASLPATLWGALMGTIALVIVGQLGGAGGLFGVAAVVGITVIILILGAHVPLLAAIPAGVYGYACAAAFGLLKADAAALGFDLGTGVFTTTALSLIVGAVLGWISGKIAGALAKG